MSKKELFIIADYSAPSEPVSFDELCDICRASPEFVRELIEFEIVMPAGTNHHDWLFDAVQLYRIKTALRLHQDLEVNTAGIAVVLDLLEELEELRAHAAMLEKHLLK